MSEQPESKLSPVAREHLKQARAEIAAAKTRATLCRHGVDRGRGTCTDCTHDTETEETR